MASRRIGRLRMLAQCRLLGLIGAGAAKPVPPLPSPVFTVTNGRSGSETLYRLFDCVAAVHAEHEPPPRLDFLMHDIQFDDRLADIFWRRFKLPRLAEIRRPFYVETSHIVCKGWFEPMLRAGPAPAVILLRRDARDIARSMLRLGSIPGRTKMGRQFYLSPADRTLTEIDGWDALDDYQCCYWHALETEARQGAYRSALAPFGRPVLDVAVGALGEEGVFEEMLETLGIPCNAADRSRLAEIRGRVFNRKPEADAATRPEAVSLAALEADVRARIRPVRQPGFAPSATPAG